MAQDPRALLQKVSSYVQCLPTVPSDYPNLQADKAAQSAGSGFSFFGGRTEKFENAADLYTQAANAFRVQKQGKPSYRSLFPSPQKIPLQHDSKLPSKAEKQARPSNPPLPSKPPSSPNQTMLPTPSPKPSKPTARSLPPTPPACSLPPSPTTPAKATSAAPPRTSRTLPSCMS